MNNRKVLYVAVFACVLSGAVRAGAESSPEEMAAGLENSAAETRDKAAAIINANRSEVGVVLSTLYQRLFTLQDQRRRLAGKIGTLKADIHKNLAAFRSDETQYNLDLKAKTDREIIEIVKVSSQIWSGYLDQVRLAALEQDELELQKSLLESDMKVVSAQIEGLSKKIKRQKGS